MLNEVFEITSHLQQNDFNREEKYALESEKPCQIMVLNIYYYIIILTLMKTVKCTQLYFRVCLNLRNESRLLFIWFPTSQHV